MTGPDSRRSRLLVVAGLVWLSPARVLVHKRSEQAAFGGKMLEFPGGKVEPGESPRDALFRELLEEWGPGAQVLAIGPVLEILHHVYPDPGPEVVLLVYHVDGRALGDGEGFRAALQANFGLQLQAFDLGQLPVGDFLPADRSLVEQLRAGLVACPFL